MFIYSFIRPVPRADINRISICISSIWNPDQTQATRKKCTERKNKKCIFPENIKKPRPPSAHTFYFNSINKHCKNCSSHTCCNYYIGTCPYSFIHRETQIPYITCNKKSHSSDKHTRDDHIIRMVFFFFP